MTTIDPQIYQLCVDLAREALEAGDGPFGSALLDKDGKVLKTDRNRIFTGEKGDFKADATLHPEFTLAKWAQLNLTPEDRATSTIVTSGEHCAMCSAAHAYIGLGPIVYVASTEQLSEWKKDFGMISKTTVSPLPIGSVAPGVKTTGPIPQYDVQVKELYRQWFK